MTRLVPGVLAVFVVSAMSGCTALQKVGGAMIVGGMVTAAAPGSGPLAGGPAAMSTPTPEERREAGKAGGILIGTGVAMLVFGSNGEDGRRNRPSPRHRRQRRRGWSAAARGPYDMASNNDGDGKEPRLLFALDPVGKRMSAGLRCRF